MNSEALRQAISADFDRVEHRRRQKRESDARMREARRKAKTDPRAVIRLDIAADCTPKERIVWRPETSQEWEARGNTVEVLASPSAALPSLLPARLSFRGRGSQG